MSRLGTFNTLGFAESEVENLSTASTALTLTDAQQGRFLVWNGQTSAARINLPQPETGMDYLIYFAEDAVSSATKLVSSGDDRDIYFSNIDLVQTTAQAVSVGSTLEGGSWIGVKAISDFRWAVMSFRASSVDGVGMNSTST